MASQLITSIKNLSAADKIVGILIGLLALVYLGLEPWQDGDFRIYYEAASNFFEGNKVYAERYAEGLFPYYGTPVLALLTYPFTFLPLAGAAFLWKLLSLIMLFRCWKLLEKYFDVRSMSKKAHGLWALLVFVSLGYAIYRNFQLVQFTILLLYTSLEGLYQIRDKNRPLIGGLLIAIGAFTKLTPIVVIPYLIYRKQLKGAISSILIIGCLIFVPAIFIGWNETSTMWTSWVERISPQSDANTFDVDNYMNHGVGSLISTLTLENTRFDGADFSFRRNIVSLQPETVKLIILITRLFFIGLMLYFLRSWPFKREQNGLRQVWEISYLLLVFPVAFPQQRTYNFLLLLPAVMYITYYLMHRKSTRGRIPPISYLYFLGIVLLNLDLWLGNFREYYWYFKTLTYGALIVVLTLAILKPGKLTDEIGA